MREANHSPELLDSPCEAPACVEDAHPEPMPFDPETDVLLSFRMLCLDRMRVVRDAIDDIIHREEASAARLRELCADADAAIAEGEAVPAW